MRVFLGKDQGPLNGGVSNVGVSRSELFCPFLSFFGTFWDFPYFSNIFPICSGMVRGFSRFVLFLFLGLLRAPTRNSPERVRDTIWTFPDKSGKHPGLETPWFSFSQKEGRKTVRTAAVAKYNGFGRRSIFSTEGSFGQVCRNLFFCPPRFCDCD